MSWIKIVKKCVKITRQTFIKLVGSNQLLELENICTIRLNNIGQKNPKFNQCNIDSI